MKRDSHIVIIPPLLTSGDKDSQPRDPSFTVYQKAVLTFLAQRLRCLPDTKVLTPTVTGLLAPVPTPEEASSLRHLPYKTEIRVLTKSIMEELASGDHPVALILRAEACFLPLDLVEQAILLLHAYEDGVILGWDHHEDTYLYGFRRPHSEMLADSRGEFSDSFTAQLHHSCNSPCSLFLLRPWRCINVDFHFSLTKIGFRPDAERLDEGDILALVQQFQERRDSDI